MPDPNVGTAPGSDGVKAGGTASEAPDQPTAVRFFALFPSVMLPMFLAVVDQTIVAAALPAIAGALGDVERVSWIVIGYLVSTTIAAPIYGQLRDTFGSRRMMFIALSIFMASSIVCAMAQSMLMLTFARVLQGLGGGGLMTLSQALIGEAVQPRERARYQGYLASVVVTSSTFGPVVGGLLTQHVGWRSIFLVNIPIGIAAMLLMLRLHEQPRAVKSYRFDGAGVMFFIAFVVPLLLAVEVVQRMTLGGLAMAVVLAAIGAGSLVLLLRQERRFEHPLLKLDLLARPAIWRSAAIAACHGATLVSLVTWLPIFFRVRYGSSAAEAGLLLLPLMISIGTGSIITGQVVARTGLAMIIPSFGMIVAVVLLQMLSLGAGRLGITQLLVLEAFIGLFLGTVMGVVQLTVQRVAGKASLGAAAASIQFSRAVGATFGTAIVGGVLFAVLALSDPEAASVFRSIIERGPDALTRLAPVRQAVISGEIANALSIAFFTIGLFAATTLALSWSHPERRL
ncbi:MAG: MFS transporter [Proteobacteria bacterium]|nr:MFS transporter [Pseudomonadota bacterium]